MESRIQYKGRLMEFKGCPGISGLQGISIDLTEFQVISRDSNEFLGFSRDLIGFQGFFKDFQGISRDIKVFFYKHFKIKYSKSKQMFTDSHLSLHKICACFILKVSLIVDPM